MKNTLFICLAALVLSPLAQANNIHYPTRFQPQSAAMEMFRLGTASKLQYYGGPVISNAKVMAVFWGPNVTSDIKTGIADFYTAIVKSDMMDWMDQYNTTVRSIDGKEGTQQHIGKGSFLGAVTITPSITSNKIDDKDIQAELQRQIDAGVLPPADANILYMTYFPPGVQITIEGMQSCAQFCAYHNAAGAVDSPKHFAYGVMPDLGGSCSFGCGFGQHFNNVTSISTHEFCEAVTDPFPTPGANPAFPQAWNDNQGSEVGDLCQGTNSLRAGAKNYTVQAEFDNTTGACTTRSWTSQ